MVSAMCNFRRLVYQTDMMLERCLVLLAVCFVVGCGAAPPPRGASGGAAGQSAARAVPACSTERGDSFFAAPIPAEPCAGMQGCTSMSTAGAPSPRIDEVVVRTGDRLIVWGGCGPSGGGLVPLSDGAIYDPATDQWRPMSTQGAPSGRGKALGLWVAGRLFVWGGQRRRDGGLYDPATDSWTTLQAPPDAPELVVRWAALELGQHVLVWPNNGPLTMLAKSWRLDVTTATWGATAPFTGGSRSFPGTQVVGDRVVVFGGHPEASPFTGIYADGFVYDGPSNSWRAISRQGAPRGRYAPTTHVVAGGVAFRGGNDGMQRSRDNVDGGLSFDDGAVYQPEGDRWVQLPAGPMATSADGRRRYVGSYGDTHGPQIGWHGLWMKEYLQSVRAVKKGAPFEPNDFGGRRLQALGRFAAGMLVARDDMTRLAWLRDDGRLQAVNDFAQPPPGKRHMVWIGDSILMWGGQHAAQVQQMPCPIDCPPGAPCAQTMCTTRRNEVFGYGVRYRPSAP